jgi:hypothetical protein
MYTVTLGQQTTFDRQRACAPCICVRENLHLHFLNFVFVCARRDGWAGGWVERKGKGDGWIGGMGGWVGGA